MPEASRSTATKAAGSRVEQSRLARSPARCAPPCRSNRATAGSASSCRRSSASRIISSWSRRPKAPRPSIGVPIHIEGYAPPQDPAHQRHPRRRPTPASSRSTSIRPPSWQECVDITTALYEEARQCRLGADKFMIDGRHTGTGGGNHVVVGGANPDDSPFLRRPDLLKSLLLLLAAPSVALLPVLRHVHRADQPGAAHRRGPPRQPLRAGDRARADPRARLAALPPLPWLVDRLFRNLLIDVTGQHPPRRDLHRQAVLAGRPDRPARPRRVPRLRDAAECAHVACPAAAGARAHRPLLEEPRRWQVRALGHDAARPLHAAAFRLGRISSTCSRDLHAERLRPPPGMVRGAARVPLPVLRRGRIRGRRSWNCARRWSPGM